MAASRALRAAFSSDSAWSSCCPDDFQIGFEVGDQLCDRSPNCRAMNCEKGVLDLSRDVDKPESLARSGSEEAHCHPLEHRHLSQRSAPQKNRTTNFGRNLDEGWARSSSQMPPTSAKSSKCNMICYGIVVGNNRHNRCDDNCEL